MLSFESKANSNAVIRPLLFDSIDMQSTSNRNDWQTSKRHPNYAEFTIPRSADSSDDGRQCSEDGKVLKNSPHARKNFSTLTGKSVLQDVMCEFNRSMKGPFHGKVDILLRSSQVKKFEIESKNFQTLPCAASREKPLRKRQGLDIVKRVLELDNSVDKAIDWNQG